MGLGGDVGEVRAHEDVSVGFEEELRYTKNSGMVGVRSRAGSRVGCRENKNK